MHISQPISRFKNVSHSSIINDLSAQYQRRTEHAGVYEDTIRISVGIEDVEDLIADFTQAIENI